MPDDGRPPLPPRPASLSPARWAGRVVRFALTLVAGLLVLDGVFGDKGLLDAVRVRRQYRELSARLDQLRRENARLRQEARRLREDPAAIEEIARRELGLIRPGEVLFVVKEVPPPAEFSR